MTVDEVASLAVYLCTEAARGITGQGIVLDGGSVQA
jgi:enoyl-[acyl-carrier-protein] reductase (NADH)